MLKRLAVVVLAILVAIAALGAPASASARTVHFDGAVRQGPTVRPHTLSLSADGTLEVNRVSWLSWGGKLARGRGTAEYHGCTPSCAQGVVHHVGVAVRLSGIVRCGSRLWYNHVRLIKPSGATLDKNKFSWAPCKTASNAAVARTTETLFHPFTSSGSPTIRTRSKRGHCFTGSGATDRRDAWRCLSGNDLFDPCFSSPRAHGVVICPNVNVTGGIELHLTRPLPEQFADTGSPSLRNPPWDIQLANGRHFGFNSGMGTIVDGRRDNYFCGSAGCNLALWGSPRRATEPWTILIAPFTATSLHHRTTIRHVWM